MEGGLLGLIRAQQQQPLPLAHAAAAALQPMPSHADPSPGVISAIAVGEHATPYSVVTAAAPGDKAAARGASMHVNAGAPLQPLPPPGMVTSASGTTFDHCIDPCCWHVNLSGRSAAAATQTRQPPPLTLFDDFSGGAAQQSVLHPPAQLPQQQPPQPQPQQAPAQPPPQQPAPMQPSVPEAHHSTAAAAMHAVETADLAEAAAAVHSHIASRSPSPVRSALRGRLDHTHSRQRIGTPLRTCRICHRQCPAGTSGFNGGGRRAMSGQSLEADVIEALLATLHHNHGLQFGGTQQHILRPQSADSACQVRGLSDGR